MVDHLTAMLTSSNKDDKAMAIAILNNRDLKNKESEIQVRKITEKYIEKESPGTWKIIQQQKQLKMLDDLKNSLELVKAMMNIKE